MYAHRALVHRLAPRTSCLPASLSLAGIARCPVSARTFTASSGCTQAKTPATQTGTSEGVHTPRARRAKAGKMTVTKIISGRKATTSERFIPLEYMHDDFAASADVYHKRAQAALGPLAAKYTTFGDVLVDPDTPFVVPTANPTYGEVVSAGEDAPVVRRTRLHRTRTVKPDGGREVLSPVVAPETQPLGQTSVQAFIKSLESGRNVGLIPLSKKVFGSKPRQDLIKLAVNYETSWQTAHTTSTKNRAEVRGGGKKPWPQKGSGRARHGSRRSPIFLKGGKVHSPRPHLESKNINRKTYQAALCSVLASKYHQGQLIVVDSFEKPVTEFVNKVCGPHHQKWTRTLPQDELKKINFENGLGVSKSAYFVYGSSEPPVWLIDTLDSVSPTLRRRDRSKKRKLFEFITTSIQNVLIKPILSHEYLVLDKTAVESIEAQLSK